MPDAVSWLIIIICLLGSFFFSCSETAYACCNRYKMQVLADENNKRAKIVLKICQRFDRALTTVLIGHNILGVALSAVSTLLFVKILSHTGVANYASIISSIIMAFCVYIIGDTFPKTVAKAIPDTISLLFAYPIYGFMFLLYPIASIFELFSKAIEKIFKVKDGSSITEEEFEDAVEKASDDEMIEEEQAEIVQSALDFIDTKVKEVYTPKEKMFALDINILSQEKLHEIFINTNYSRIPIYDQTFDNMIGVLVIKQYFEAYSKNKNVDIRKILNKPYFVTNEVKIDDLFQGFKKHHTHVALIKDNNNHIIGMATMEDVLEELVSDISEPNINKRKLV